MPSAGATSLVPEKARWRSIPVITLSRHSGSGTLDDPEMRKHSFFALKGNGGVGVDFVLLRFRLRLVLFIDVLDRTFAGELARQDHHADEAAVFVGSGLREYGVRSRFVPRTARSERRRATVGVDANAAVDEATDARPLVSVQISAAPGRKSHTVAAHQKFAFR